MSTRQITKGSTNVSINVVIVDDTDGTPETGVVYNTSGIDMWYRREGAAKSSITEATLAALTTAHTDGGFLHISNGVYRLDVPDAAFATGVDGVQIGGTVTGMVVFAPYVELTDVDLYDGVRGGMTALPNAAADAAGGLPISDAGGLDLDGMNTNINDIETDTNSLNDTKIPQTLNLTASGNIGIDWANVENPTTAVDLSGTDIQLCDTVTTNTDMRGTDSAATATNLATVDTVVDAIKVKTDQMVFTKANELDINMKSTNGQTISGDGSAGDPFQGA